MIEMRIAEDEVIIKQERYQELLIKESDLNNIKKCYLKGDYIWLYKFVGFVLGLPSYEELQALKKTVEDIKED